jgi:uroporphyrinogen decarboxylase
VDSRERVRRAVAFQGPDRVPYFHRFLDATRQRYPALVAGIEARYPSDMAEICWHIPAMGIPTEPADRSEDNRCSTDEWGCVRATGIAGLTGIVVHHPIADWRALESYVWPDYASLCDWDGVHTALAAQPDRYHVAMYPTLNLFERMQALHGFETLMCDLAGDRHEVLGLRDRIVDTLLVAVERWLEADIDAVAFGDDWGTQSHMMIDPDLWRRVFRPVYERLFEPIRQAGKSIRFHSDGMVLPIIPDLIAMGVDILNVQQSLIGLEYLEPFRGRVCFQTNLDSQWTLPYGTPADVRAHVRDVFRGLGTARGGVIGYAAVGPDVPSQNIEALYAAYLEFDSLNDQPG